MAHVYRYLCPVLSLGGMGYWWAASRDVKTTSRREPRGSRLLHTVPLTAAGLLLWLPTSPIPV